MLQNLKNNLAMFLFSLPFAGVGVGMLLLSILPSIIEWREMQSWQPVDAELLSTKLEVHHGDDSDTYQVQARYRYQVRGQTYENQRVAISTSADNIGHFQQELGARLSRAYKEHRPVQAWVNPENPHQAILNREMRWNLLGFSMIFVVVFGGVGFGLMVWSLMAKPDRIEHPQAHEKPWLSRREWSSNELASDTKAGLWGIWLFAIFWNVISSFCWFIVPEELEKGNYTGLIAAVFPLIGLGLLYWAIKETLGWRRFGNVTLRLDPYPGSIGGQVGGILDIPLAFDSAYQFPVNLTCLYSYESGSGKNRSRKESVKWEAQGYAYASASADAPTTSTRLEFCFNVPHGLPASEPPANTYHLWRVRVQADLPGIDFDRGFTLPVFPTTEQALTLRQDSAAHPQAADYRTAMIESVLDMRQVPGGIELYFPAFRHFKMKMVWIIIGAIFGGAGVGMSYGTAPTLMVVIFSAVGGLMLLGGLYALLNSLRIRLDRDGLAVERKLLGIAVVKQYYPFNEIRQLYLHKSYTMQTGSEHIEMYAIKASIHNGKKITIGESLQGRDTARQALEAIGMLSGYNIE